MLRCVTMACIAMAAYAAAKELNIGVIYPEITADDYERFEEYTRITNEMVIEGLTPQSESLDNPYLLQCTCTFDSCQTCTAKQQLLVTPKYILAVQDNVYGYQYQRVLSEISDSETMPCGLFFGGHHEDVAHLSICIAMVLVTALLLDLAYMSYQTAGSGKRETDLT